MKPDITLQELLGWDGSGPLRADLHSHSAISDGSYSSAELLQQAADEGLTHLAITNHDTTKGIDAARTCAENMPVSVHYIGGIEISAWDPERERKVHILGLGLKEDSPAIAQLCGPLLQRRHENSCWQQEQLEKAGYQLDHALLDELVSVSTALYKQHLMAALTTDPFRSQEYQTLYRGLFKGDGICKRDITYVNACDAVCAITEDGGVAVLAHPGQLKSYEMVSQLVDAGLWGIEEFHPDHATTDWCHCEELAQRYGLVCTGGSDFHGTFGEVERLGQCTLSVN